LNPSPSRTPPLVFFQLPPPPFPSEFRFTLLSVLAIFSPIPCDFFLFPRRFPFYPCIAEPLLSLRFGLLSCTRFGANYSNATRRASSLYPLFSASLGPLLSPPFPHRSRIHDRPQPLKGGKLSPPFFPNSPRVSSFPGTRPSLFGTSS